MTLRGSQRIGIVLSVLWALTVASYAGYELSLDKNSPRFVTELVIAKTGEPISAMRDNPFSDLIPVKAGILIGRLSLALVIPIAIGWTIGWVIAWVRAGFTRHGA